MEAKRFAVFVKEREGDRDVFTRRPYDLLDGGPGNVFLVYHPGAVPRIPETYDGVRIFDVCPPWDLEKR